MNITEHSVQSMSSKEIADLTGKRHANVLRDIKNMISQVHDFKDNSHLNYLEIQGVSVDVDSHTKRISAIHLDKDHTLTLLTGYDAKARFRVIQRWQELEQKEADTVFQIPCTIEQETATWLGMAKLFKVPEHLAQIEAVKSMDKKYSIDFSPLLTHAPEQDNIGEEDVMLEPTELAQRLNLGSAVKANCLLLAAGLQEKVDGRWFPTEKGKNLCAVHSWKNGSKSGYNLKWKVDAVAEIIDSEAS